MGKTPAADVRFECLYCEAQKAIKVTLKKKQGIASLRCSQCDASWRCPINHLDAEVDVYDYWESACRAAAQREVGQERKSLSAAVTMSATPARPAVTDNTKKVPTAKRLDLNKLTEKKSKFGSALVKCIEAKNAPVTGKKRKAQNNSDHSLKIAASKKVRTEANKKPVEPIQLTQQQLDNFLRDASSDEDDNDNESERELEGAIAAKVVREQELAAKVTIIKETKSTQSTRKEHVNLQNLRSDDDDDDLERELQLAIDAEAKRERMLAEEVATTEIAVVGKQDSHDSDEDFFDYKVIKHDQSEQDDQEHSRKKSSKRVHFKTQSTSSDSFFKMPSNENHCSDGSHEREEIAIDTTDQTSAAGTEQVTQNINDNFAVLHAMFGPEDDEDIVESTTPDLAWKASEDDGDIVEVTTPDLEWKEHWSNNDGSRKSSSSSYSLFGDSK